MRLVFVDETAVGKRTNGPPIRGFERSARRRCKRQGRRNTRAFVDRLDALFELFDEQWSADRRTAEFFDLREPVRKLQLFGRGNDSARQIGG